MSLVSQSQGVRVQVPAIKPVGTQAVVQLSLPTERSQPKQDLGDYTWLVYGEKKIGKTSLAAQFPDALFMMFEPGGKGLSIYQRDIGNWAEFKQYVKLLKDTKQFKTVVIDTIDIAYDRCLAYVGNREGFAHPSDKNDYGKSWQMVAKELADVIYDLVSTGRGVMFLSHAKESEFQEASGNTYNKIIPTMSNSARGFVTSFVDVIAYYGYYGNHRMLTIRGSDAVDAGHRIEGKFRVIKEGEEPQRIFSIPMGDSAEEGYQNILTAFANKQTDVFSAEKDARLSEEKAKRSAKR